MAVWEAVLVEKLTDEEKFKGEAEEFVNEMTVKVAADTKGEALLLAAQKFTRMLGRDIDVRKEELQVRPF